MGVMPEAAPTDGVFEFALGVLPYGFLGAVVLSIVLVFLIFVYYYRNRADTSIPRPLLVFAIFVFLSVAILGIVTFANKRTEIVISFFPETTIAGSHAPTVRYGPTDYEPMDGKILVDFNSQQPNLTVSLDAIDDSIRHMENTIEEQRRQLDRFDGMLEAYNGILRSHGIGATGEWGP